MDQKLVSFLYRSVDETELHAVFFFFPSGDRKNAKYAWKDTNFRNQIG